jgi:hypothetical protein
VNGTAGGKASSTKGGIWPLGKVWNYQEQNAKD